MEYQKNLSVLLRDVYVRTPFKGDLTFMAWPGKGMLSSSPMLLSLIELLQLI